MLKYWFWGGEGGQLFENFHFSRGHGSEHGKWRGTAVSVTINQYVHRDFAAFLCMCVCVCIFKTYHRSIESLLQANVMQIKWHSYLEGMMGCHLQFKRISRRVLVESSLDYLTLEGLRSFEKSFSVYTSTPTPQNT